MFSSRIGKEARRPHKICCKSALALPRLLSTLDPHIHTSIQSIRHSEKLPPKQSQSYLHTALKPSVIQISSKFLPNIIHREKRERVVSSLLERQESNDLKTFFCILWMESLFVFLWYFSNCFFVYHSELEFLGLPDVQRSTTLPLLNLEIGQFYMDYTYLTVWLPPLASNSIEERLC